MNTNIDIDCCYIYDLYIRELHLAGGIHVRALENMKSYGYKRTDASFLRHSFKISQYVFDSVF